jgi:hypothetical protein
MSVQPGWVTRLPRTSNSAYGAARSSGLITLDVNCARERSAITPHAAFDAAGAGNVAGLTLCRRASPRPYENINLKNDFELRSATGEAWLRH